MVNIYKMHYDDLGLFPLSENHTTLARADLVFSQSVANQHICLYFCSRPINFLTSLMLTYMTSRPINKDSYGEAVGKPPHV